MASHIHYRDFLGQVAVIHILYVSKLYLVAHLSRYHRKMLSEKFTYLFQQLYRCIYIDLQTII